MAAITISRELGSEGTYIATKVAASLGYHYADKDLMAQVLSQYGYVNFGDFYDSAPGLWARFDDFRAQTTGMLDRIIKALAQHGDVVILGRGSFAVLGGLPGVLNVRVQAPFAARVRRIMERMQIADLAEAEAFVRSSDRTRAAFVEFSYGVRCDMAGAFDVVIDTEKVPPDLAVTWLAEAAKLLKSNEAAGRTPPLSLEVDAILAAVVSKVLACEVVHAV